MESNESISELLSSRLPQSANLAAYQKEVTEHKQGRVELLKELKLVQLQILQLHALCSTSGTMFGKTS